MNPISVEELAQICHLSLTHFRRTFESVMHISPLYYLNSVPIDLNITGKRSPSSRSSG